MGRIAGMRQVFLRVRGALLLVLTGLFLVPTASHADIPGVSATLEPVNPSAEFHSQEATLTLRLLNNNQVPVNVIVEARRLLHKNGSAMGRLVFPELGGSDSSGDRILPAAPAAGRPAALDIKIQALGMKQVGTYQGSIDIVARQAAGQRISLPVEVQRQVSSFGIVLGGASVANGVMTVKPQSVEDQVFSFRVENPETAPDVEIMVQPGTVPSGRNGRLNVKVEPPRFQLLPGSSREVQLTIEKAHEPGWWKEFLEKQMNVDLPALSMGPAPLEGTFTGSLNIIHAQAPGLQKSLSLVVQPNYMSRSDKFWLVALVFMGTLVSLLLGTVVPTMIARQKAWARLRELSRAITSCAGKGTPLQIALLTRLNRLDYLAHDIWWFSPRAEELLKELTQQTDTLEESVKVIRQVHRLREYTRRSGRVPVSIVPAVTEYLVAATDNVIVGHVALAQEAYEKAAATVQDTQMMDKVQKSLQKNITNILGDTADFQLDPSTAARRAYLAKRQDELSSPMDGDDILILDRECYALHLYIERYRNEILMLRPGNPDYLDMDAHLIEELASGMPGIWRTVDDIESMAIGVLQKDIDEALGKGLGEITITPSVPSFDQLVEFKFKFSNSRLDESPLTARLHFRWDFGDGFVERSGPRCLHYFKKQKRGTPGAAGQFKVKVSVSKEGDSQPLHEFEKDLFVSKPSNKYEWLSRAESVNTLVGFLGAAALAYMSHLSDIRPLENIQDYFNPILWGFGLDQMKALVTKTKAGA